jgi:hypothetical protein
VAEEQGRPFTARRWQHTAAQKDVDCAIDIPFGQPQGLSGLLRESDFSESAKKERGVWGVDGRRRRGWRDGRSAVGQGEEVTLPLRMGEDFAKGQRQGAGEEHRHW